MDVMSPLTKIKEMSSTAKQTLDATLLVSSASIAGTIFLKMWCKYSMIFSSKLDIDAKLVMPSWAMRSTNVSELSFVSWNNLNYPLKD